MTLSRPNLLKLLGPVAVFCAVLFALIAMNGRESAPSLSPEASGPDIGRSSGDPVRDAQALVRATPESASAYAALGDAYLSRGRETGDPGYLSRAGRAFAGARRRDASDVGALVGAATLAGLRHDFREELQIGRNARRAAPDLARPYTVVFDAQIELGRYGKAAATAQRLVDLKPSLAAYARVSYYRELTGDLPGALAAMRLAASAGGTPESRAFSQALVGDLELAGGNLGRARDAYEMALRSVRDFPAALTGLARIDAAGGDLGSAAARLRRAADLLPLTTTLTLLSEVELALSNRREGLADLAAARAEHRMLAANGTLPDAEAVLFEANHGSPTLAVMLGRRVWRLAPSIRSADALGWALTRAGRPAAGYLWSRRALSTGSRDPSFNLHAALAAKRSGRPAAARAPLSVAKRGRAALSPAIVEELR